MESNDGFDFKLMENVLCDLRCQKNPQIIIDRIERGMRNLKDKTPQKKQGTVLEKYNKKIEQIQTQNIINHNKKIDANRKKEERMEKKIHEVKKQQQRKKLELIRHIKDKEIKTKKILAEREQTRIHEKQNKEIKRYFEVVKQQNITLIKNQTLIDKCIKHIRSNHSNDIGETTAYEEEIKDEPLEEMIEEECFVDSDQLVK